MEVPDIIRARLEHVESAEATVESAEAAVVFAATASTVPKRVGLTMETQIGTQWCWAAVAASFARHRGAGNFEQCKLAKDLLPKHSNQIGHDCCTIKPPLNACDKQAALVTALTHVGVPASPPVGSLLFSEVKPRIDAKKLIACMIHFPASATNHFVQLEGYIEAKKQYIVNDPQRNEVTLSFNDLLSNYNNEGGLWQQTILIP